MGAIGMYPTYLNLSRDFIAVKSDELCISPLKISLRFQLIEASPPFPPCTNKGRRDSCRYILIRHDQAQGDRRPGVQTANVKVRLRRRERWTRQLAQSRSVSMHSNVCTFTS